MTQLSFGGDLSLPNSDQSRRSSPLSLTPLLYKGGASQPRNIVDQRIKQGALGKVISSRLPVVRKLHTIFLGDLTAGASPLTVKSCLSIFRLFVTWIDNENLRLEMHTLYETYVAWCDHLVNISRTSKSVKVHTLKSRAQQVGRVVGEILNLERSPYKLTRISALRDRRSSWSSSSLKLNLDAANKFGAFLLDVSTCLNEEAIFGSLPAEIRLRDGRAFYEWSGLIPADKVKSLSEDYEKPGTTKTVINNRNAYEADRTIKTRHPLINLRIMAEFHIFISQTGMNVSGFTPLTRTLPRRGILCRRGVYDKANEIQPRIQA